jgi:hypothetical protein
MKISMLEIVYYVPLGDLNRFYYLSIRSNQMTDRKLAHQYLQFESLAWGDERGVGRHGFFCWAAPSYPRETSTYSKRSRETASFWNFVLVDCI